MTMGENMQISLTTLRFNRVTLHERLVSKGTFQGSRNPMKLFSRHKEKSSHFSLLSNRRKNYYAYFINS